LPTILPARRTTAPELAQLTSNALRATGSHRGVQRAVQRQVAAPLAKVALRHRLDRSTGEQQQPPNAQRPTDRDAALLREGAALDVSVGDDGRLLARLMPEGRVLAMGPRL
jgi:hypothetical protein